MTFDHSVIQRFSYEGTFLQWAVQVIPELDDGLYTTTCKYLSPLLERENENAMPYAIDSFDWGDYFLF